MKQWIISLIAKAIEHCAPLCTELDVALSVEAIIKSIQKCETYGQLYAVEKAIPSLLYDRYMYADYAPYLRLIRDALQRKSIMLQTGVEI